MTPQQKASVEKKSDEIRNLTATEIAGVSGGGANRTLVGQGKSGVIKGKP